MTEVAQRVGKQGCRLTHRLNTRIHHGGVNEKKTQGCHARQPLLYVVTRASHE